MSEFVSSNIDLYGPVAIFLLLMLSGVGIPVGEDIIVIPAGILVGRGDLPLFPTLLFAYMGVCGGDILWFIIVSRYGSPLLHRRWFKRMVHPRRLLQAKHQVEQRGIWVIVFARFIPGGRTPVITTAAMLHLPLWKFALATCSCVMLTVPMQLTFGWLIARGLSSEDDAQKYQFIIAGLVLVIVAIVGVVMYRRYRRYQGQRPPRADSRWLKRYRAAHRRTPTTNQPS